MKLLLILTLTLLYQFHIILIFFLMLLTQFWLFLNIMKSLVNAIQKKIKSNALKLISEIPKVVFIDDAAELF